MSAANVVRQLNDALTQSLTVADSGNAISLSKTAAKMPNLTLGGNLLPTVVTATSSSGAATITGKCAVITTESLTTAQNAFFTLTVTATGLVSSGVPILCTIGNGTNSAGTPMLVTCTRTDANTVTISIQNKHASAVALNGTLIVSLWILG